MLSVANKFIMLSVVMLNVVMLSVVAPLWHFGCNGSHKVKATSCGRHDTQHNGIQYNGIQHNDTQNINKKMQHSSLMMLNATAECHYVEFWHNKVFYAESHYAKCHYAECRCAECRAPLVVRYQDL